jgi:hypothetical protein
MSRRSWHLRIGISDHKLERIADLKDVPQTYDDFAMCWGMTPDGSPLLLRNTSSQQVYALDLQLP